MSSIGRRCALGLLALGLPMRGWAAHAQTPPPQVIPGLGNFSIERPRPAPVPTPTPTPAATAVPVPPGSPVVALPVVRPTRAVPTRAPRVALPIVPTATASPLPPPIAPPTPAVTPTPVATPSPQPVAPVASPPVAARTEGSGAWPWLLGVALIALGVAAALLLRRRRVAVVEEVVPVVPPTPRPTAARPPVPSAPLARLSVTLRPVRAGLNLLSATAECEVIVANTGDAPATDIRVGLRLLSAGIGQEADLTAVFAEPVARPAAPPFALQPGEERRVRGIAALPRDAIRPMSAAGRPMFVPLVAVNLLYTAEGAPARTGQAFAIGVERADSSKLAPFWLDAPPRMHDAVGARPHVAPPQR